jgi:hypothetical protein
MGLTAFPLLDSMKVWQQHLDRVLPQRASSSKDLDVIYISFYVLSYLLKDPYVILLSCKDLSFCKDVFCTHRFRAVKMVLAPSDCVSFKKR